MMARAATSPEITKFQSPGQWSQLFLAFDNPAVVFACRVNQTFSSLDDIRELIYDGVTTGAYTDILPGMTVYIGSSLGAYDLGMERVRKTPTSTILYIGRESEIAFADNLYLTVVDEQNLWAKHWYVYDEDGHLYMDTDIVYSDQNTNCDPIVRMGTDLVVWLSGGTISIHPDASLSSVLNSTVTGYAWSAPGSSSSSGMATATPTITYTSVKSSYRLSCTITAANGKSFTGYRRVFVFSTANPPTKDFIVNGTLSADVSNGGWVGSVSLFDQSSFAFVRDRVKVILFSVDYYGDTQGSIGPVVGSENIILSGWILEENLRSTGKYGTSIFKIVGPAGWLDTIGSFPAGLKTTGTTPTEWRFFSAMTTDAALWHLCHWRSTIDTILDVTLSNDIRVASGLPAPAGSLWSQLKETAQHILAVPLCDRYGRLFIEVDTQYLPLADRSSIPIVQALTNLDWCEELSIDRVTTDPVGMLEVSGASDTDIFFSRSSGSVYRKHGSIESRDNLLVTDQTDLNAVCGMLRAQRNNPYPSVQIPLVGHNRLIDITPRQYLTLTTTMNPRALSWTNQKLLPRRVEHRWNPSSRIAVTVECEGETSGTPGQTVIPPVLPTGNNPPPTPLPPPPDPGWTPIPWFPPIVPPIVYIPPPGDDTCFGDLGLPNRHQIIFDPTHLSILPMDKLESFCYFPCSIRPGATTHVDIYAQYMGATRDHFSLVAIDSGKNTILSPSDVNWIEGEFGYAEIYDMQFVFDPETCTEVAGFKLVLATGGDALWVPGSTLTSGTVAANNASGDTITGFVVGQYYSIEGTGGAYETLPGSSHWRNDLDLMGVAGAPGQNYYGWQVSGGLHQEAVGDGANGRGYFQAGATSYNVRVVDLPGDYGDNTGSKGFLIRNATVSYWMGIRDSWLYNVVSK